MSRQFWTFKILIDGVTVALLGSYARFSLVFYTFWHLPPK